MITKKLISLLVAATTAMTSLSLSFVPVHAETQADASDASNDSDTDINTGGILGDLMSDQFQIMADEDQEKQSSDNAICKIEFDAKMGKMIVDYKAKSDSTIFIGFYDDEGTKLYQSVTVDASASNDGRVIAEKPDGLPEYYLIKAFMVGKFSDPLTQPYIYDKCTKNVSDIVNATPDAFDEDKVIMVDENEDYNFIVTKDEYVTIYSDDKKDTLKEIKSEYEYVFENIDKVKGLSKGQTVLIKTPSDAFLFIIDTIDINDSEAVITRQDVELDDIISFIKFDTEKLEYDSDSAYVENLDEDISYELIDYNDIRSKSVQNSADRKLAPNLEYLNSFIPSINAGVRFHFGETEESGNFSEMRGNYVELGVNIEVEIYYNNETETNSVGGTFEFYAVFGLESESKIEHKFGDFVLLHTFWINVIVSPKVFIKASSEIEDFKISKKIDFGYRKDHQYSQKREDNNLPDTSKTVKLEAGLALDTSINFINKNILGIHLVPEAGIRASITSGEDLNNAFTHHKCTDGCCAFSASFYVDFYWGLKIFNIKTIGSGDDERIVGSKEINLDHDSIDNVFPGLEFNVFEGHKKNGTLIEGPCPNMSHKVVVNVMEINLDHDNSDAKEAYIPSVGAQIFYKSSSRGLTQGCTTWDSKVSVSVTDKDGKAELWIDDTDLLDEECYIVAQTNTGLNKEINIGKRWDPELEWPNTFTIYLDSKDMDLGSFIPDKIPCGAIKGYDSEKKEYTYYDVYAKVWSSGNCWIFGDGSFDPQRLIKGLKEWGLELPRKIVLFDVVVGNNCDASILPVESVEYIGNGKGSIGSFKGNESLKEVKISNCSYIPYNAFLGCEKLEKVELSNDIETIGSGAFSGTAIQSFECPLNLKEIGSEAFSNCKKLEKVIFNDKLTKIGSEAFLWTNIESFVCPSKLRILDYQAFFGCHNLSNVSFNYGLEEIGELAFGGTSINKAIVPFSVKKIGRCAFSGCEKLEKVILNNPNVEYGNEVFSRDTNLKNVILPYGLTEITFGEFSDCNIENIQLPETIKKIGEKAFQNTTFGSFTLPDTVTEIGRLAFCGSNLSDLKVPSNLQIIEEGAFEGTKIEEVIIPENISEIKDLAFEIVDNSKTKLQVITILNRNCKFGNQIVPSGTVIYGYKGSSAEAYVTNNNSKNTSYKLYFKALPEPTTTTTTTTTTTAPVTTTTTQVTAVITNKITPEIECVMVAVKSIETVGNAAKKLLEKDNVGFIDQKTSDSDGNVSFSYVPNKEEKWTFVFITEAVDNIVTTIYGEPDNWETITNDITVSTVKGDANGDWGVDMSDIVLIMQALANPNKYGINGTDPSHITENGFKYADVDGGGLTNQDALKIQRYLLNEISSLD